MPSFTPPPRYAESTFNRYAPQSSSQQEALEATQAFAKSLIEHYRPRGFFRRRPPLPARSLYLVGPVGTGKTHLLAALYHALIPTVPAAFVPSGELLRTTATPEAWAARVADEARVLLLDEVELDDPAGEVRLVRTLKALDRKDVVVAATSNIEPEKFIAAQHGGDRFRRFLDEFRSRYQVIIVGGDDYRRNLAKPGKAWVGDLARAKDAMQTHFNADGKRKRWLTFSELVHRATHTPHPQFVNMLAACDHLYLEALDPRSTDDALRLLRLLDDLYTRPDAPTLFYTASTPPEAWLTDLTHSAMERGVSEKFNRTTSRLNALSEVLSV